MLEPRPTCENCNKELPPNSLMLTGGLEKAGLEGLFEAVLGTGQIRTCKPDPRAYAMAIDALRAR
jgi:beta-phosphoglucomutase-like phosphatase (HAD superfamily)